MDVLQQYIQRKFGIDELTFLKVIETSPGAEGYLLGNLGEYLFREHVENLGYEALRIKEKPSGGNKAKNDNARGDFYIRKKGSAEKEWLVVECKGVKSNAEKRSGLTNLISCRTFLKKHSVSRPKTIESTYKKGHGLHVKKSIKWEKDNLGKTFPPFRWSKLNPGGGIPDLSGVWDNESQIEDWIKSFPQESFNEASYWGLTAPVRLLQTHMPSTRTDPDTHIKSTGPLVNEFSILCVDLFLKTGKHEFVFAASHKLNPQRSAPNHLQQNYTIDILTHKDNFKRHRLLEPWYDDLDLCVKETSPPPRPLDPGQLDLRNTNDEVDEDI